MAHVLVADDDSQMRALLRTFLEGAGHHVREAADGAAALRALRREPADLLLCDLFMPGKDGMETLGEARRAFPRLPVVAMSGGSFQGGLDLLPMAEMLGAARALHKPFGRATLLAAVEQAIQRAAAAEGHPGAAADH